MHSHASVEAPPPFQVNLPNASKKDSSCNDKHILRVVSYVRDDYIVDMSKPTPFTLLMSALLLISWSGWNPISAASTTNFYWTGIDGGTWETGTNWTMGYAPTSATTDYPRITNDTSSTVNKTLSLTANESAYGFYLGGAGTGNLNVTLSGAVTLTIGSGGISVGQSKTSLQTLTIATNLAAYNGGNIAFNNTTSASTGSIIYINSGYTVSGSVTINGGNNGNGLVNINGTIIGAGNMRVNSGTVNWNGTWSSSYTGDALWVSGTYSNTDVNPATLNLYSSIDTSGSIRLGTGTSANSNAALYGVKNGVIVSDNIATYAAGTAGASSNVIIIGANDTSATASAKSTVTYAGNYAITDTNARIHRFFATDNNIAQFNGTISGGTAGATVFQKTGNGTVIFGGTTANTYNSSIGMEVVAGTLLLQKTAGVNALNGNVTVDSGATLQLGASNQIANAANLTLAGGSFNAGANSETLGSLTLTGNSILTLGSGSALVFANSANLWTSGMTLTIYGTLDGTTSTLRFGTDATGLSSTQLSEIVFADYSGYTAAIDASGFITAVVPEPSSVALLGATIIAVTIGTLRRRRHNI